MQNIFNDNAANLFWETSDQGGYEPVSVLQNENQDETFRNQTGK